MDNVDGDISTAKPTIQLHIPPLIPFSPLFRPPVQPTVGSTYIEDGATVHGDISDIGVSGTVDENAVGSYTITYSATDSAGNKGTATRTVNVKDTTTAKPNVDGDISDNPATDRTWINI